MRVAQVFLNGPFNTIIGQGISKWIPHDYWQTPPAITLAGFISSGAILTWAVQYTPDDIGAQGEYQIVSASQLASTTLTVNDSGPPFGPFGSPGPGGHGLSVGDYVRIAGTGIGVDGEYTVATIASATQYTVVTTVNQTATASPQTRVVTARVFTHSTLTGQNGRQTGNFAFPVRGSRLQLTAYTSGTAYLEVLQGGMSS